MLKADLNAIFEKLFIAAVTFGFNIHEWNLSIKEDSKIGFDGRSWLSSADCSFAMLANVH